MLLSLFLLQSLSAEESCVDYGETCNEVRPGVLNVHLVAHSHDDTGYRKTVDQYYYGTNNDKTKGGIQYTIDSVLDALEANKSRRFNQVEIAYFWRWWREASHHDQLRMRRLIEQRRFSFLLGGWCMNDEAVTTYKAMIEQNGLGLKWLRDEFGCHARPHAAWQIDTFGHTRGQAEVFANMGYDSVYFARLDVEELAQRNQKQESEVIWKGNLNRNDTDLFTGNFINGQYSCPDEFCYGPFQPNDDAIVDNEKSDAYNVDEVIAKALNTAMLYNETFLTNHVMWTMGKDNAYAFAHLWYKNMDKLVRLMNEKAGDKVNFLYSTPECYTLAKNSAKIDAWPVNEADYMPLRTSHRWWTGFYSTRSNYKAYVRETYSILAGAHHLLYKSDKFQTEEFDLARAYAIGQHHDGITGTHAQFVQEDYLRKFSRARNDWFNVSQTILNEKWGAPLTALACDELNSTICTVSENTPSFSFGFYNPSGFTLNYPFRIPLSNPTSYVLEGSFDLNCWDLIPLSKTRQLVNAGRSNATHELLLYPQLKQYDFYAANFTTIDTEPAEKTTMTIDIEYGQMNNNYWTIDFNKSGVPGSFQMSSASLNHTMKIDVLWYNSTIDGEYGSDDAYNFYPYGEAHSLQHVSTQQTVGTTFNQMELMFSNSHVNVSLVMRLYSPDDNLPIGYDGLLEKEIEIEWTVLSYTIPDKSGKNIVVRYSTDINNMVLTESSVQSNHTLLKTDSSGRFWIERVTDFRPNIVNFTQTDPIAGNYYPLVNRARIQNQRHDPESLTIFVDRSHGAASLSTGQVEIMVQRRINNTDDLAHDISEPGIVTTGKQLLVFGSMSSVEQAYHEDKLTYKPNSYFWPTPFLQNNKPYGQQLIWKNETAPYRVVSVQRDGPHQILVCLEHLDNSGDDDVEIDFKQLLKSSHIKSAEEFYLGGDYSRSSFKRLKWSRAENVDAFEDGDNLKVNLKAGDLRMFKIYTV